MIDIKNVLVATDFSEPSMIALNYGRDLARSYDATLHVIHVVEDLLAFHGGEMGLAMAEVGRNVEAAAREDLDDAITASDRESLRVRTTVLRAPNVSHAITEYAKQYEADLIVVGTHGRGTFQRFLIGSVAERVMRTAPCPVLTVRAQERSLAAADSDRGAVDTGTAHA